MRQGRCRHILRAGLGLLAAALAGPASGGDASGPDGRALLDKNCGRCHAIDGAGASPLAGAPPLRDIYRQRPTERLEFEFSEGMGSRHPDMPQIQFSAEEVAAILTYLDGITRAE